MQHIAILRLRPEASEQDQAQLRKAEVAKVWELLVADSVRTIHFFSGSGRGAVLHIEAPDQAQADALVRQLPMVAAGLLDVEILTLTPFSGLQALFA
jgi:hypothetical protein